MRNISDQKTGGMPRRDFILLGSAAVAAVSATGVSASALRAITGPVGGSILSIGYSDAIVGEESGVVSAKYLGSSDRTLATDGVRLTIHGYWRPEARRSTPLAVEVTTFFPVNDTALPVVSWSYVARRDMTEHSSRGSLVVPTDADGGVSIAVDRRLPGMMKPTNGRRSLLSFARSGSNQLPTLASMERDGNVCRLADRGGVKLQPGTYFIALGDATRDKGPDWSRLTTNGSPQTLQAHGESVLMQQSVTGRVPVDFEYLMVSVAARKA
jgi:hypothetical protein